MNVKGSGLSYYKDYHSDEMRLYEGGLREVAAGQRTLEYNRRSLQNSHDAYSYERGTIYHSRSPSTQYLLFHYMYGGFYRHVVKRLLYEHAYKRVIRILWMPLLTVYTLQCLGIRNYDNKAYNFYYFID